MDEEATQQSTQPFLDPRRQGDKSMLSEEDEADVLCVLHPSSPAAYEAVKLVAATSPQHILQNDAMSQILNGGDHNHLEESKRSQAVSQSGIVVDDVDVNTRPRETFKSSGPALEIALRLSSKLKDPCLGFTFGRLTKRCDLVITDKNMHPVSGMHFRIFMNPNGVIMLEDTSTNGTHVDEKLLQATGKGRGTEKRRMLTSNSIIQVMCDNKSTENVIKFIVKLPERSRGLERWRQNVQRHVAYILQLERRAIVRNEAVLNGAIMDLPPQQAPFNPMNGLQGVESNVDATRNLATCSDTNIYGMEWNGGDTYNVVGYLGSGAFATVFQLATKSDGDLFAVKQIDKRAFLKNGILDQKINNEMQIMGNLRHPNIVEFVGHEETKQYLYIIMEFVPCKDLSAYLRSESTMLEFSAQSLARQICGALEYLHTEGITHRDIKPENILVQSHDPLSVKLSDFGLSKRITSDGDYLKTFCGTILYCAPEIYPGYETYKKGLPRKRSRAGEPPLRTAPYKPSVDIWAFAAVLYHLLSGSPPFEGTSHGQMLERIMRNPVDYGKLKNAGVSPEGIKFVSKMLVLDPALRATELECLQSPWLSGKQPKEIAPLSRPVSVPRPLGPIGEDQEEESVSQLSQLSLIANPNDLEHDTDVDETKDTRRSKRFKSNHMQINREKRRESSSGIIEYPSLPDEHAGAAQSTAPGANRLFGEIGASALRSSDVLDYNAHTALQLPLEEESHNFTGSLSSEYSQLQTPNPLNVGSAGNQYPSRSHLQNLSAPSLLGAESLVGQLNMASSGSSASAPSPKSKSTTSANSAFYGSGVPGTKRPGQTPQSSDPAKGKRAKTDDAQESPTLTSYGSSSVFASALQSYGNADSSEPKEKSQINGKASKTELNHQDQNQQSLDADGHPVTRSISSSPSNEKSPSKSTGQHGISAGKADFARPRPRLGIITTIPGSVCNTKIKLEQRWTSFGRDPLCHVQYKNTMDVRVPRAAFDIVFWRPGLEALIESGTRWDEVEGIFPIVITRTSLHIRVNGIKLTKGKNCWLYGRLHTGDVITVFGPVEGEATAGKDAEFLKFRCEFFTGPSAKEREVGRPRFVVEKEVEKFQLHQMRLSNDNGGQGNSGGHQDDATIQPSGSGRRMPATMAA